ncbi:MAG TPA: glycosyltransferase family 39 protein [Micromonosporaceae bacterium]|jgi:hypothetical protein
MHSRSDEAVEPQEADGRPDTPGIGHPAAVRDDEARSSWRYWPAVAIVVAAGILVGFGFLSQTEPRLPFGYFSNLPLYGIFAPIFRGLSLTLIASGLLAAAVAWAVTSSRRIPSWLALVMTVLSGLATAMTVGLVRGDWHSLIRGVSTNPKSQYFTSDLHFVDRYGVRGFVSHYPSLLPQLHLYNARTHPPGVQVFLWVVWKISGPGHQFLMATILAVISLLIAVGAWSMARSYGGDRAGRIAALLVVAAPGPLLLAYTNMDIIFAAAFSIAAALFVIGMQRRSMLWTAAGGVVLGFATFLTYATTFVALAVAITIVLETRSVRQSARLLVAALVGGVAALALLRLVLGFDVLATYRAMARSNGHDYLYWIAGHPGSVLIWAGLPIAALGLAGLVIRVPGARRPLLPMILVAIMFVWGLLPPHITTLRQGEVERTWSFLYPMLAVAAGLVVDRWTRSKRVSHAWSLAIIPLLVLISIAQTGVIQALWDNLQ